MTRTFGNFEPGSLGCLACGGLGEILPPLSTSVPGLANSFAQLRAGAMSGGNFEHFDDLQSLGWVPNTQQGYATYLQYNSLGLNDKAYDALPEFLGWMVAADGAYAIVNKMHQGNNLSPVWDVPSWTAKATATIQQQASTHRWTTAQHDTAMNSFADHFPRLLQKWGYKGTIGPVSVPQLVKNPYFESLGQTVWVDKATITYDGPDPDPTIVGGRMFSAGGKTWHWGGTVAKPSTDYLDVVVDGNDQVFDQLRGGITRYKTKAWFILTKQSGLPDKMSAVTRWVDTYLNFSDVGPRGTLLFYGDLSGPMKAAVDAQTTGNTPPPSSWGWSNPPLGPAITDLTAAPPTTAPVPSSQGSQPTIAPGVPPVESVTGALVPAVTTSGVPPEGSGAGGAPPNPADALPAIASWGGALIALGVIAVLVGSSSRRRRR